MIKTKTLALVAAAAFALTSAYAGDKACCASHQGKKQCSEIYAKLNLRPEQKSKLDTLQADCVKEGCTKGSMDKFMQSAKKVLSQEQYAQLKTECESMAQPEQTKS